MRSLLAALFLLAALLPPIAQGQMCFPEVTCRVTAPPAVETIAAGGTITANACGSVKRISSAGSITTSTTDTFTTPASDNAGCVMTVCNTGSNDIVLDNNANFVGVTGGNVTLTAADCLLVAQRTSNWAQVTAVLSGD